MKAAQQRGEDQGLFPEQLAFYDALAETESAVDAMGSEQLRLIAHELLEQLRKNATVDWHHRESARARMRVLVKRILKSMAIHRIFHTQPFKQFSRRLRYSFAKSPGEPQDKSKSAAGDTGKPSADPRLLTLTFSNLVAGKLFRKSQDIYI